MWISDIKIYLLKSENLEKILYQKIIFYIKYSNSWYQTNLISENLLFDISENNRYYMILRISNYDV